jgi:hypothetical protein
MINPLIGCIIPFALALLLLSAAGPAGKRLEEHRAYVRKLCVATPTDFVLQRFGKSCVMDGLSFAVLITADGVFGGKELVNTREHVEQLIETIDTGIAPVRDRAGTVAERCSTGLTRYAT